MCVCVCVFFRVCMPGRQINSRTCLGVTEVHRVVFQTSSVGGYLGGGHHNTWEEGAENNTLQNYHGK